MKHTNFIGDLDTSAVALFARAWIETNALRGRKRFTMVALFERAWIETVSGVNLVKLHPVALFARAWIETSAVPS